MNFWEFVGLFFWGYLFFAYLMVLFSIVVDIFRDSELSGWLKAVWIFFLVFVPIITAIVYVIVRGRRMSENQIASAQRGRSETDQYIRSTASNSPVDDIAKAKALLDSGSITRAEFDGLKARAMSGAQPHVA